jgi:hypothetical protein
MRGKRNSHIARGQVNKEGVLKLTPVALEVPLGHGQSDYQGRCCVTTANFLYKKRRSLTAN